MQTIYVAEQRPSRQFPNGRIKFTNDRDCLAPDVMRVEERVFCDDQHIMDAANCFVNRGFAVCVDTDTVFTELEPYQVQGRIEGLVLR